MLDFITGYEIAITTIIADISFILVAEMLTDKAADIISL